MSDNEKKKKNNSFLIEFTDRSGEKFTYAPPSSATAVFTKISDRFIENQYAPLNENRLIDGYITKDDLELYVKLGYLGKSIISEDNVFYHLTDKGRNALEWNREFRKKWQRQ